jgi:hypothetical protein
MLEKLKPVFKAIQKFVAKEFLWVIICTLLALPVAFLLRALSRVHFGAFSFYPYIVSELQKIHLPAVSGNPNVDKTLQAEIAWFYFYILGFAGIYLVRFTASSVLILLKPKESA